MDKESVMNCLSSSGSSKFVPATSKEEFEESKSLIVGSYNSYVSLNNVSLREGEPGDDEFKFCLVSQNRTQKVTFTRNELEKGLFQHDINMLVIKARSNNQCHLAQEYPCDSCCYEEECPGMKFQMVSMRFPRDLDPVEDKDIIESVEFMAGLEGVCWRIDDAIAARLLLRDE